MSWLQSLRDDFTLRPFEIPQTPGDSAAMASGSPDLTTNQEPAEVKEESSGKKKSKFKTFKKFFARKKRKEPSSGGAEAGLKASQSIDNVSKTLESNSLTRSEKDKGSGSKISLGGKAMSHDSVFVSDSSEANDALGASQDSIHGKVKSLQLQLKQAIRLGSPPSLMCVKKAEDAATMSEDDGLPCSPPFHSRQDQRNSSNSLHGLDNDQLSCAASSRAVSPLVVPGDFSQPASPFACLDNSAAKHKLGLRHKAHTRRKPVRRLDGKTEADAAVEEKLVISTPGAEANTEEEEEQNYEGGIDDQLKPKVVREADEEEEEEEEKSQAENPRLSLLRGEEGEDESEARADVSHGPDASCRAEQSVSEEETSDGPPVSSSESSSRASPLDPPRNTPEPPAGSREHVIPSASSTEEDNQAESGSTSGEEEAAFQEEKDGECSLLEEVLSSLKTPLKSCSLDRENVEEVLELKEETEKKQKEMEAKEEERVDTQASSPCSGLSDLTSEDQRDSYQEEDDSVEEEAAEEEEEAVNEEEEESGKEEEEALNEEEEPVKEEEHLVVEHFNNHDEETKKGEEKEDKNMPTSINEEEEEEFISVDKKDDDEKDIEEDEVQQQEAEEETEAEKMREMTSPQDEEDQRGSLREEADEVTKVAEEEILLMQDEENDFKQNSEHVEEDEEEEEGDFVEEEPEKKKAVTAKMVEQEVETAEPEEQKVEQEVVRAEQEVEQEVVRAEQEVEQEMVIAEPAEQEVELEVKQEVETAEPAEQEMEDEVEWKGDDLKQSEDVFLSVPLRPESQHESHSQESVISPSSKTSTLNIDLVSPSSEKSFQFSPVAVSPGLSVTEFPTAEDEEEADTATKEVAKEEESPQEQKDFPSVTPSPEETKVRFTIAPAWQRSQSLTPPSSSPVCTSSPREEEVTGKDHTSEAKPAGEAVLDPGKVKPTESPTYKSQASPSTVKAPSPAAANTPESSATTGGNSDNPFGVRLRKTSTLLRFNSEEENPEAPVESVNSPTSCKAESPQVCSKPSTAQPVCNKPALPKKPELQAEVGGKLKRFSDPPRADPPSWISVAKQKQKLYKENSLDEITLKKEEQEKKSPLSNKEPISKAAESSSHVAKPETIKPSVSSEKDPKRALSPQTPAASQPIKSHLLPCPIAPKPQVPPPMAKHRQPSPPRKPLPPPTPVPVHPKPPSTPPCKPTATFQTTPVPPPSFVSRTTPEKSPSRSAGPPGPRGLPSPALPQDEPPWMALAKKKAKAWSEMPQIVQ